MKDGYEVWTCPIMQEDCPYCNIEGYCTLKNPLQECEEVMDLYALITINSED